MKALLFAVTCAASVLAFADKVNPYSDYGDAMKPVSGDPMAIEWQLTEKAKLADATAPEALAAVVEDEAAAAALLNQVKDAYDTHPMIATKVAAVTQYVMEGAGAPWYDFWTTTHSSERKIWAKALLANVSGAPSLYGRLFALEQLRWCGLPCQAACVRKATVGGPKPLSEFGTLVAHELEARE